MNATNATVHKDVHDMFPRAQRNTNQIQSFTILMNITDATVHKGVHGCFHGRNGTVPTDTYTFET
jgi:hypothetical protein